mgnify:CR=1 FL=1
MGFDVQRRFAEEVLAVAKALGHYWAVEGHAHYEEIQKGTSSLRLPEEVEDYIRSHSFLEAVGSPEGNRALKAIHANDPRPGPAGVDSPDVQLGPDGLRYEHTTARLRYHITIEAPPDAESLRGTLAVQSPPGVVLVLKWQEGPDGVQAQLQKGEAEPGARHYEALDHLLRRMAIRDPAFQDVLAQVEAPLREGHLKDLSGERLHATVSDFHDQLTLRLVEASRVRYLLENLPAPLREADRYSPHAFHVEQAVERLQEAVNHLQQAKEFLEQNFGLDASAPSKRERDVEHERIDRSVSSLKDLLENPSPEEAKGGIALAATYLTTLEQGLAQLEKDYYQVLSAYMDHWVSLEGAHVYGVEERPPEGRDYRGVDWTDIERVEDRLAVARGEVHMAQEDLYRSLEMMLYEREVVTVGPNGNSWEYAQRHPLEHLMGGGTIAYGSFSSDTGYSGWWDEVRLGYDPESNRMVLVGRVNETDTSFRNPAAILEEPVGDWERIKLQLDSYHSPLDAYRALGDMLKEELEALSRKGRLEAEALERGNFEVE